MDIKDYYSKQMIKAVYGLAVIMMVLHHLYDDVTLISQTILPSSPFIEEKISFLAKLCVAIYSFLAGTGAGRIKCEAYQKIYFVIAKRALNLYFKYWFVFIICIPLGFGLGFYRFNVLEFLLNFLGLSSSYNGTWWFVYQYIVMLIFAPVILQVINQRVDEQTTKTTINIIMAILIISFGWICVLRIGIYVETVYFIVFIIGIVIEKFKVFEYLEKLFFPVINAKAVFLSLIGIATVLGLRLLVAHLTPFWFQMDIFFAPVFVFCLKPILSVSIVNRVLSLYGVHSTMIWLSHAFICDYYFSKELFSVRNPLLLVVEMLVLSLILGILLDTMYVFITHKEMSQRQIIKIVNNDRRKNER